MLWLLLLMAPVWLWWGVTATMRDVADDDDGDENRAASRQRDMETCDHTTEDLSNDPRTSSVFGSLLATSFKRPAPVNWAKAISQFHFHFLPDCRVGGTCTICICTTYIKGYNCQKCPTNVAHLLIVAIRSNWLQYPTCVIYQGAVLQYYKI